MKRLLLPGAIIVALASSLWLVSRTPTVEPAAITVPDSATPSQSRGFAALATLPSPDVSFSTLPSALRDSATVVLAWTKRCSGTLCPFAWRVSVTVEGATWFTDSTTALRDTFRIATRRCPGSVHLEARVIAIAATTLSAGGRDAIAIRCRAATTAEKAADARAAAQRLAAYKDSLPAASFRNVPAVAWAPGALKPGVQMQRCLLARNRYTGTVIVIVSDKVTSAATRMQIAEACEGVRASYQSERAG